MVYHAELRSPQKGEEMKETLDIHKNYTDGDAVEKHMSEFDIGKSNPYIYVRLAFRYLSLNRFEEARGMMERALLSGSRVFRQGSLDEREFKLEIQMLRVIMLFLTDKFGRLPAE